MRYWWWSFRPNTQSNMYRIFDCLFGLRMGCVSNVTTDISRLFPYFCIEENVIYFNISTNRNRIMLKWQLFTRWSTYCSAVHQCRRRNRQYSRRWRPEERTCGWRTSCEYQDTYRALKHTVWWSVRKREEHTLAILLFLGLAQQLGEENPEKMGYLSASDVNWKPKIWYTKKIPIPNRYLVFLSQFSWYFLGILSIFLESPC